MDAVRVDVDYWSMSDADLAAAWRGVSKANLASDYDGSVAETVNFVEDAILQRIGAPDDASGDDPQWQKKIEAFGGADAMQVRHPEIEVQLTGEDGNAFAIIGKVCHALRRAHVPAEEVSEFTADATSGDYDHVLQTCMKWVEVS